MQPGSRVLDAGCGTGILSLWAAQAGAAEVVGIDMDDVGLASRLAAENGLASKVSFRQSDLRNPDAGELGEFDALIAMLYLNDPRRDQARSELVYLLRDKLLKPGGLTIPNRVEYLATAYDWPDQRYPDKLHVQGESISEMETAYGLKLQSMLADLQRRPPKGAFPERSPSGNLARDGARALSDPAFFCAIDYRQDPAPYPPAIELSAKQDGELNVVVWTQLLKFNDTVIFSNESVSWLEQPVGVDAGKSVRMATDNRWRDDNLLA